MEELIFRLAKKDEEALGTVRCINGLQAAFDNNSIWLKGISVSADIDTKLKQLPVKNTFTIDGRNNLFLTSGVTPVAELKELLWQPLNEFIKVEPPVSALPGKTNEQVSIKLITSKQERKGMALLTTLKVWKEYAETASAVRLQKIEFAVSEKDEVLIIGNPLPALPGKEYWRESDILLPSGYDFEIPMIATFMQERINPDEEFIILFDSDGCWQKIGKCFFVEGKRSAIRLTKMK